MASLEEAIAFFDRAEEKARGVPVPEGFFPVSVYAKQKGMLRQNMKPKLDRLVELGLAEKMTGRTSRNAPCVFYRIKEAK